MVLVDTKAATTRTRLAASSSYVLSKTCCRFLAWRHPAPLVRYIVAVLPTCPTCENTDHSRCREDEPHRSRSKNYKVASRRTLSPHGSRFCRPLPKQREQHANPSRRQNRAAVQPARPAAAQPARPAAAQPARPAAAQPARHDLLTVGQADEHKPRNKL